MRAAVAALLLLYAIVMAAASSRWLPRASWPLRAPRTGIAAWQAAVLSVITSTVSAGLVLAIPCLRVSADPAALRACLSLMRAQYATPRGAAVGVAGGLLALGVLGRITWCTGLAMAGARRRRASHDDALALVARPAPISGVRIIDDDQPAVYCVPGRRRIVLTTRALRRLDSRQIEAVLAHERAHLSERHHLVLTFAAALRSAFPAIRVFAVAAHQVSNLVEVAADDAAVAVSTGSPWRVPCWPWPPPGSPPVPSARAGLPRHSAFSVLSTPRPRRRGRGGSSPPPPRSPPPPWSSLHPSSRY